jgi:glycosyltransferase involved in cell wall biosynthesis
MSLEHVETLSVLTPSFNYVDYVGTCIDSVRLQESSIDVQHVIVDDGSTDASWDVIRAKHPNWRRDCVRQPNAGLAATLNRALAIATGDWLLWLNADDFLLPDALRLAEQAIRRVPDADIIFGDTVFVDETSRLIRLVAQPVFDRRLLEGGYNCFHTPSVLWRRALLTAGRGWDESLSLLLDLDLWLTITGGETVVVKIDAPLSAFRRHPRQISATRRDTDIDEVKRVAAQHDLPGLARVAANASTARSTWPSKLLHGWLKVIEGCWWREWGMKRWRGRRMDWTNGPAIPSTSGDHVGMSVRRSGPNRA